MRFDLWSSPQQPALIAELEGAQLAHLLNFYGGSQPHVFRAIVDHALRLGAGYCVVEYRYIDADYRNEHSRYYSTTFRRYPTVAHRIHFFAGLPKVGKRSLDDAISAKQYLGYTIMRPIPAAPVGRTMLPPSSVQREDVTCTATDWINLFGRRLSVTAAPFMSQDGQLGRCAQATIWMTAYLHHLGLGGPRVLPGDIAQILDSRLLAGRGLPSQGLGVAEIAQTSHAIGLPAITYPVHALRNSDGAPGLLARYLDSGFPVTIVTPSHAFMLVGHRQEKTADGSTKTIFLRHDDGHGPYQEVDWLLDARHGAWQFAIVPLPRKVYLAGEEAEIIASQGLTNALGMSGDATAHSILDRWEAGHPSIRIRTRAMRSNAWKESLGSRPYRSAYHNLRMSRWIWVTEIYVGGKVVGEAVVDATEHPGDAHLLAWRVPGEMRSWNPDLNEELTVHAGRTPALSES